MRGLGLDLKGLSQGYQASQPRNEPIIGVLSNRNTFNSPKGNTNILGKLNMAATLGRNGPLFSERSQFVANNNSFHAMGDHVKYQTLMSNRGKERKSVGAVNGNADIYLPHLRPKGIESQNSPRSQFGVVGAKSSIAPSDINGSQCSPRGKFNGSLLSPILKGKQLSTAAGSSFQKDMINSFDNSKYKISVMDMVNSAKKTSLEEFGHPAFGEPEVQQWDAKKDKPSWFGISKDMKPRDFLTQYTNQHRHDPGPKYEVELNLSKKSPDKCQPPRTIIKKDNIPSYVQEIENQSKKVPGPGRYDTNKKRKIYGNYLYKATSTFTDEALYRGYATPSHYNPIDMDKIRDRVPKTLYVKPKYDGPLTNRIGKIPKNDEPSCATYRATEAFYKTSFTESTIQWPLNKAKRTTNIVEYTERKASVPAPSQYHPEKADTITSIGARGKIGYYSKVSH